MAEQRRLQSQLIQSEKLAGIGTLAAGVAHEISSPLFGIMGLAEAIPDALVDEIAIACTPDEARDRLHQWDDLASEVMLYAPQVGVAPGRVRDNPDTVLDVFRR